MKIVLILVFLLAGGLVSIVYAHPIPSILTVYDPDGAILYEEEYEIAGSNHSESVLFSLKWFYHNSMWLLIGGTIVIGIIANVIARAEETTPNISSLTTRITYQFWRKNE